MKVIYWLAIFIVLLIIEIATMGILCGACRLWTGRSGWDIYRSFAPASASDETTCGEVL